MSDPAAIAPAPGLSQTFKDANGDWSSKRMAAAFAVANMVGLTWFGVVGGALPIEAALYVWGGFAFASLGLTVPEWLRASPRAAQ